MTKLAFLSAIAAMAVVVPVHAQQAPSHTSSPVVMEPGKTPAPTPSPTAAPSPTATPAPYSMTYGPGSCDTYPDQAICHLPASTLSDPKPWLHVPLPTTPEPVSSSAPPAVVPLVYTSTDGYHWTLRPGRPQ